MKKVMIVEDSKDIRSLLQNYLEKYGYQTVVTSDFTSVLDLFLREKPDVVLLDINLPSYDGYYWCRQIRQHSTSPIIFISARSGEMDQVMAIENGGDDYIEKPFSYDIVLAKIKSQIRGLTESTRQNKGKKCWNTKACSSLWNGLNCVIKTKNASCQKRKASCLRCCWKEEKR